MKTQLFKSIDDIVQYMYIHYMNNFVQRVSNGQVLFIYNDGNTQHIAWVRAKGRRYYLDIK